MLRSTTNYKSLIVLLSLFLTAAGSCRKFDHEDLRRKVKEETDIETFFAVKMTVDPLVKKIASKIKAANLDSKLFKGFIQRQGIALWDKAIVQRRTTDLNRTDSSGPESGQVIIPLVMPTVDKVRGALIVNIEEDSIHIRLLDGNLHPNSNGSNSVDATSARHLSLFLMNLHKQVYQQPSFLIIDSAAFPGMGGRVISVNINDENGRVAQRYVMHQTTVCITYSMTVPRENGNMTGCPPVGECPQYVTVWQTDCQQLFIWEDDGTGYGEFENDGTYSGPPPTEGGAYFYDANTGWEPAPEACDPYITTLANNAQFVSAFQGLNSTSTTGLNYEKNVLVNDLAIGSYSYSNGIAGSTDNTITLTTAIDGRLHSHYAGLNSIFSPQDIIAMCEAFIAGKAKDCSNFFYGLTSDYGIPYIFKVNNCETFRSFAEGICGIHGDDQSLKENFVTTYNKLLVSTDAAKNEVEFLKMLNEMKGQFAATLYRGNSDCNVWSKLSLFMGNEVQAKRCN